MPIYDPTPDYERRLQAEGWARIRVGVRLVRSPRPSSADKLAGLDWGDGCDPVVRGRLDPRFWTRSGNMQVTIGPLRVDTYNDLQCYEAHSQVSPAHIQTAFEATLDVLAKRLAKVREEHGGGSFKVVFAGGGHLCLPDSFRRVMGKSDIDIEILNPDGSTSVVPAQD